MALSGYPFPWDITNLLSGAVRILYAPTSVAVPDNIGDVIDMESPYSAQTGWVDLGATKENFSYSRNFDVEGLEIQQVAGNVLEEITSIDRAITLSQAEFSPFGFQLMENAPSVATIAASAGKSSQKEIAFGSFASLERRRYAFISRRPKASGVVTESDTTTTRGRFLMGVAYEAQLAADEITMEQGKGELTAVELAFTLFPTAGEASGKEVGAWFIEDAGTIAA